MADGKDLEQQFHDCMPLFIALGDEMRLTIIKTLAHAVRTDHPEENIKRLRACGGSPQRHLQLLQSQTFKRHPQADADGRSRGGFFQAGLKHFLFLYSFPVSGDTETKARYYLQSTSLEAAFYENKIKLSEATAHKIDRHTGKSGTESGNRPDQTPAGIGSEPV